MILFNVYSVSILLVRCGIDGPNAAIIHEVCNGHALAEHDVKLVHVQAVIPAFQVSFTCVRSIPSRALPSYQTLQLELTLDANVSTPEHSSINTYHIVVIYP